MEDLIQDGFIVNVSGTSRGKLKSRIFHLLSSRDGRYYICNPNSSTINEIHAIDQIKSVQNNHISRLNIHYKNQDKKHTKALSVTRSHISNAAIEKIIHTLKNTTA